MTVSYDELGPADAARCAELEAQLFDGDDPWPAAAFLRELAAQHIKYVAARAIQLFARGVPQIYYVGLLAGENDHAAVARTGEGRAINRHDYTIEEIEAALQRPVVRRVVDLVRLRNSHPAFDGTMCVEADGGSFVMRWTHGQDDLSLEVDFAARIARITDAGVVREVASWAP